MNATRRVGNPWRRARLAAARCHVARREGFTALEVLLAISAATLLGAMVFSLFVQGASMAARFRNDQQISALRDALEAYYRDNFPAVESSGDRVLALGGASVISSGADLSAALCPGLARYLSQSLSLGIIDGHGRPFRIYISDVLHPEFEGTSWNVRRLAIVSAGPNGRFESTAWDPVTGLLLAQGDDTIAYIDGLSVLRPRIDETQKRMSRLATLVRGVAGTRYLANPSRDITIDYFGAGPASAGWDEGGFLLRGVDRPAGPAGRLTDGEIAALGISRAEATDPWGQDLAFDNDSPWVRQPANPAPGRNLPPWSARVTAAVPGGGTLVESIDGVF